ncbi:uncharacterized protein LOC132787320 isoform X2 [Drosophila nasuta]|uniref:uncharacterized protein LOC132787320 isoform X2 n=1 Tax=Drosophila nasuta TaxID=42062 RepID=UPI00295EDA35|nr:uncharacterized protein LOC132787320 isoform X2 [Drosophila nasuta]
MYYKYNNYNTNNNDSSSSSSFNSSSSSDSNIDADIEQQLQAARTRRTSAVGMSTRASTNRNMNTSNNSGCRTTSKTRARAMSLIYLPPFCYPCGHSPEANVEQLSGGCSCSCCCQPWEHTNYDKHASATTMTAATATATATAEVATSTTTTKTTTIALSSSSSAASSEVARKFLQRDIQLPMDCIDLRHEQKASQLVMPIVGGDEAVDGNASGNGNGNVLECVAAVRRQRRERMRRERERQSHGVAMSLAMSLANPISSATTNNSQTTTTTTTTTTALATTGETLPHDAAHDDANDDTQGDDDDDDDVDDDECRCFNYNGDISALERLEQEQEQGQEQDSQELPSITWLKFWQQLLHSVSNSDSNSNFDSSSNATTQTTKMTTATTATTTTTTTRSRQQPITRMNTTTSSSSSSCIISSHNISSYSMTLAKSWLGALMLTMLLATSVSGWGGRQDAPTNCTFPARWEGSWFLSGYQQSIHIKGSQFSYRGRCAASDGNKYLIVDEKGCHRCLVIYEKHKNVLQYKESECEGDSMYMHQSNPSALAMRSSIKQSDHRGGAHPNTNGHSRLSSSDQYIMRSNDDMNDCPPDFCKGRETLQNLCDQIPGDALLYSLFRESAEPVKCPLKGPFIFTYNRGHGECKSPVSNIESCTEESRLLLSFQACPDVQGTESTVEELTCLATWKDGNSRYLVGLVSHHHAISNEERYRCFVYEKISSLMGGPSMLSSKDAEYKLAQSGDATCNGLDSAEVGSRIMSLRKPPAAERCDFPAWFKGPRHWHALMGNAVYNYHSNDGSVHIIKPNGYMETRALCEQINKQTSTEMMAVVHYTTGCQSGFMCMMFYRRDTHVIEIQTGKPASRLEDACAPDHFDFNKMAYITLLASNPEPHICPMEGLYNLRGAIGPPYLVTRHKRNHNGKSHLGHGHHHHESSSDSGDFGHKGHSTLSFRNAERMERDSWHANTRGLPVRSRRNAPQAQAQQQQQQQALVLSSLNSNNDTSVGFIAPRSRRDVPGCVTNYNAQRQLWVGCSAPNAIDVSPLCSVDGEEEYSCHGSWSENSTVYIIARHKGTKHGVCISYRPTEGNSAKLVVGDACYRGTQKPPDHHLVANLSVFGKCGETGSSASTDHLASSLLLFAMLTWLTLQS